MYRLAKSEISGYVLIGTHLVQNWCRNLIEVDAPQTKSETLVLKCISTLVETDIHFFVIFVFFFLFGIFKHKINNNSNMS